MPSPQPSALVLEQFTKNLDEEEREEADRSRATGFNNLDAANEI